MSGAEWVWRSRSNTKEQQRRRASHRQLVGRYKSAAVQQPKRPRVDVAPGTETGGDCDSPAVGDAVAEICAYYQMPISHRMLNASG